MKKSHLEKRLRHYETQIKEIKEELELAQILPNTAHNSTNILRLKSELQLHREGLRLYKTLLAKGKYEND